MSTEESREESPPIAPRWRRGLAGAIDIAFVASALIAALLAGVTWGAMPFVFACFIAAVYCCPPSPGKRMLGLHLVRSDGSLCTMGELLNHELLQLPAVMALLLKRAPLWKMSSMFDGRWGRTAVGHQEGLLLVYCPELSGKVRSPDPDRATEEGTRVRFADPTPTRSRRAPRPGQTLFSDEELFGKKQGGLLARSGKVHAADSEGNPRCGVENKAMTPTGDPITCMRCNRHYGGTSKSKKRS
jgi:uncharacterized RDD family membrane protein YckC